MTSPAGGASAPAGDGGDAGQQAGESQQSGPDISALAEQLGTVSQGQEELRQLLTSQFAQAEPAQEEADPNLDLSFLDDAGYDQEAAANLADAIDKQWQARERALEQKFEQKFNSVNERVTERERMEQMAELVHEFPDMANPEVAKQIVQQANTLAEANGWPGELGADPRFWRVVYAAQQSFQRDAEEGTQQSQAAHLEGGSGAAGAPNRGAANDIVQALDDAIGGGRNALPFP